MSNTVMLIHGAWLTSAGWSLFRARCESRGYKVHAPAWPLEDVPPEELRQAPDPELRKLTIGRVVRHYEDLIRTCPSRRPSSVIGHSGEWEEAADYAIEWASRHALRTASMRRAS